MLSILQTGDLHLGKIFYEFSLLEDQSFMLDSLFSELTSYHYDALIISGDVYDKAVPPPEAVSLFDRFLSRIHNTLPGLAVCIIPGNHDSAKRLGFAAELLENEHIYIASDPINCIKPVFLKNKEGSVEAALYQLPFLQSGALTACDGTVLRSQEDLVREAVKRIQKAHRKLQKSDSAFKDLAALLSCHVFTTGAQSGGSERIFIGTAEQIDASLFDFFAYTAAGHIHKMQKVTDRMYYAGSPLSYSFDEAGTEKKLLRVEFNPQTAQKNNSVKITALPVKSLRRVVKITGNFEQLFRTDMYAEYAGDYVECTYTDSVVAENAAARLREKFPFLLSVKREADIRMQSLNGAQAEKKRRLLEAQDRLPLKDILYSFLKDAGLLNTDNADNTRNADCAAQNADWEKAVDLFVQTEQRIRTNETA
ncbi:exonuclease subunit SbcD [Treponema sp. OMZ 840]|uniref:exonuclease SbcCD subunit D n=1 Tax=Treponema sp. OMZ 840 TaxID=244313 RepID=UPI003D9338AC